MCRALTTCSSRAALAGLVLVLALAALTACSPLPSGTPPTVFTPTVFTPNPGAASPGFPCPPGQHWKYAPSGWGCVRG